MKYQISGWNDHFENDRSRQRDKCSFVCVPNKQHGMGFCRIMSEPDGAMVYGIWHLILGACSQQSQPRNGWLTVGGDPAGSPWGVEDMALKFRRPELELVRALEVLASEKVGWIIKHESPSSNRQVTADSQPTHLERKKERTEGNGEASIQKLRERLGKMFQRKLDDRWSYAEEHSLAEVAQRAGCVEELALIECWRDSIPPDERRFHQKVQTLFGLLSTWTESLDKSKASPVEPRKQGEPKHFSEMTDEEIMHEALQ